jgi:hypothetical protein
MAHGTMHFYQEPSFPYHRNQQERYEVGVHFFQKYCGDLAGFICVDADLLFQ